MSEYKWRWSREGRMAQVRIENGEDIAHLAQLDRKHWNAIAMPVKGQRFDAKTLAFLDTDGDGRVRTPEIIAAIEFLKSKNVNLNDLFNPSEDDIRRLDDVMKREADLAALEPSEEDRKSVAEWEAKGKSAEVAVLGEATAAANDALAAVEPVIDAFFAPPEDMPLVTEAADVTLPLRDHLNPKHLEKILAFAEKCVKPVLGDVGTLDRMGWKKVRDAFAPYRAWAGSKPVVNAGKKSELEEEEKVLRYKLNLLTLLENYVNMRHLYTTGDSAIFQTGVLRIDGKELSLCFHVESEAAHSALSGRSNCCVLYLKLTRPGGAAASVCAVVTAGGIANLYVGRNGVFYDRDGKDWDAVVTKVVENQVSLLEAFWMPWRKLGEGVAAAVKKFLGAREAAGQAKLESGAQSAQAGGAAMASSVAAIGIGVGMVGAAAASLMAAISSMTALEIAMAMAALVLVVSLPSVILTWFKLRKRDLGAILNAGGWAVNKPLYFSMRRAGTFTKVLSNPFLLRFVLFTGILLLLALDVWLAWRLGWFDCVCG